MTTSPGVGNRAARWGLLGALVLALLACTETTGVGTPPAVTSTALRPTVEQAQVDVYLDAIVAEEERRHADATLTAVYAAQTATAVALQRTATAESARATAETERQRTEAALQAEQVQQAQLETRRQRIVYPVKAYGPWVVLLALVAVVIWGGYRLMRAFEIRLRSIPRDARGDAPVLVFQQGDRIVAYDPDRAVGPATVFAADVHQPQLTDPNVQERTTARDQTIDLRSRGLPRRSKQGVSQRQAQRLLQRASAGSPPRHRVQVVAPQRVRPWLREVRPQALRNALTIDGEAEVLNDS